MQNKFRAFFLMIEFSVSVNFFRIFAQKYVNFDTIISAVPLTMNQIHELKQAQASSGA